MSAIYGLLAISIVIAIVFFLIFVLSVKKGQYDDAYTPSVRMLFDDELVDEKKEPEGELKEEQKSSQSNHKHKQV